MDHACSCHGSSTTVRIGRTPVRADQTVAEVTQAYPGVLGVLKEMGVNHCCGAHLSLAEAAASAGIPLERLMAALDRVVASGA